MFGWHVLCVATLLNLTETLQRESMRNALQLRAKRAGAQRQTPKLGGMLTELTSRRCFSRLLSLSLSLSLSHFLSLTFFLSRSFSLSLSLTNSRYFFLSLSRSLSPSLSLSPSHSLSLLVSNMCACVCVRVCIDFGARQRLYLSSTFGNFVRVIDCARTCTFSLSLSFSLALSLSLSLAH